MNRGRSWLRLPRTFVTVAVAWGAVAGLVEHSLALAAGERPRPFGIQVVDAATGRGVPLVELRAVDSTTWITDNQGWAAIDEPWLAGREVFFYVTSHGYEFPADGFGFRGTRFQIEPGGLAEIKIERRNLAERLYRLTGAGLFRDSLLLGQPVTWREGLLNAQVTGSDSVQMVAYRDRLCWFWGDTNRPGYPLGNFHTPGARSRLPGNGGLDPSLGVDLEYFVNDEGFARPTAEMPGEGPTWIDGLCVVPDAAGEPALFCAYAKIKGFLTAYSRGLARWNDATERFEPVAEIPLDARAYPFGHALVSGPADGEHVYFGNPFPLVRVPARAEALGDWTQYEAFTCLVPGTGYDPQRLGTARIERDAAGQAVWGWKRNTAYLSPRDEARLVRGKSLSPDEARHVLVDVATGDRVVAHAGSTAWNAHRGRWLAVVEQSEGKPSALGEIWLAESESLEGPWRRGQRIVTHDKYSFYNPQQHPELDQAGGRLIYFEGTYSDFFAGVVAKTPRYDYNQIMYRLDLDDARLRSGLFADEGAE